MLDSNVFYIENTSTARVLGATSDGNVNQQILVEGKADQLWGKGELDAQGFFTLQNVGKQKLLTVKRDSQDQIIQMSFEIKGIG